MHLSEQHLKEVFIEKVKGNHLDRVDLSKGEFVIMKGSDISKKHIGYIEGQE